MAPENNNWLSFSLSSMEMLNSSSAQSSMLQSNGSSSADSHQYYFADNFFPHGWTNQKAQVMYTEGEKQQIYHHQGGLFVDTPQIIHQQQHHHQPPPKLEDFFGGETETQDSSSLTHIYDHHGGGGYYHDGRQDLNINGRAVGFQTFSTNSGSEVDDSQVMGAEFATESSNELGYSQCVPTAGALSLAVNTTNNSTEEKAIVTAVDSESCKKISDTFGQRTSIYRGVTRHRWTGRYEAHLWDNSCKREGQARKGRQVYLGGYDKEDKAARSYDLAALKYWGATATTNFPASNYTKEIEEMKHMTKQEFIASLRRKSSGFSRGASMYRGVTRHHQQGRWQARIGRVAGNKDLYLGTFATEEEAAEAYDIAAIKFRGVNAVTNFEMNRYDVEAIMKSSLPIGGAAKRLKISLESEQKQLLNDNYQQTPHNSVNGSSNSINFGVISPVSAIPYGLPFDTSQQPFYHHSFFPHLQYSSNNGVGASDHTAGAMPLMPSPGEIFIWPNQSY
ncbi:AP2-like ethylene-responsive transcription factor AIL6 [Lycium barbarum]|uniref:AP2-like ethylene-responsive transcription factor AIL6 n=1 Tax=Lycium barbarum TaxID=112863 RepID=UPI00293F0346|nr:AP2-like ethylene-responsive transcription factor AIL6 [Lycium barbarum]